MSDPLDELERLRAAEDEDGISAREWQGRRWDLETAGVNALPALIQLAREAAGRLSKRSLGSLPGYN